MKVRSLIALAVVLLLAAFDAPGDAITKEKKVLRGTWKLVAFEREGKSVPPAALKELKWVITADKIVWTDERKNEFLYKLDPAKKPKAIDLIFPERKTEVTPGIYSLEGDELKVCVKAKGGGRPSKFAARAWSGQMLYTLKREKP
jgi:uncharacterized protein (TIGR03067 family)